MAFLVCYSDDPPRDHTVHKAAYMDQSFYELIFAYCRGKRGEFRMLGEIASLRYKSPELVVSQSQLPALAAELDRLVREGFVHPQVAELRTICMQAASRWRSLTISADMYPELGRGEEAAIAPVTPNNSFERTREG